MPDLPPFATIRRWCQLSGMGRDATFAAIKRGDIPARKLSARKVLIDVPAGLEWIRGLPRPGGNIVEDAGK